MAVSNTQEIDRLIMASSSSTIMLISSLVLLVLAGVSTADQNFVLSLCKDSLHVNMCTSTLLADARTLACTTKMCVSRIGVEHALKNASDTRGEALKILNSSPPPGIVDSLHRCTDGYANAMSYLNTVLGLIDAQNFPVAETTLGTAQKEVQLCEQAFAAHPNPMTQWNTACDDMLDVAFELVDQANV